MSFRLFAHPGARSWVPPTNTIVRLRDRFPIAGHQVHMWPRAMVAQIRGRPETPYAFRAYTSGTDSHIFVDDTETPTSIVWLIAHELTHRLVNEHPQVARMLDQARPADLDPRGDRFHQVSAEERLADGYATRLAGARLDRDWWRQRAPAGRRPPPA